MEKKEKPGKAGKGKSKQPAPAPAPEPAKEERERRNSGDAPKEQRKGKQNLICGYIWLYPCGGIKNMYQQTIAVVIKETVISRVFNIMFVNFPPDYHIHMYVIWGQVRELHLILVYARFIHKFL